MNQRLAGLGEKERSQLALILQANLPVITPQSAAPLLGLNNNQAAQLLARWHRKGWLSRVKRGAYLPVPLQSVTPEIMADEPWVLAQGLFHPCYIGGWSAAEHWGFTEQLFNSTMIITVRKVPQRELQLRGAKFTLKTVKLERLFGTKGVWLQQHKVEVSDPTKTIIDAFNDPAVIGGIRMAVDALHQYMHSEHKNLSLLFDYAMRMNNSAISKRLGFVFASQYSDEIELITRWKVALKLGYSQLDPATPGETLITEWRLWVPAAWKKGMTHDHDG